MPTNSLNITTDELAQITSVLSTFEYHYIAASFRFNFNTKVKYGVSFGDKIITPDGPALVFGEYEGQLCFIMQKENILKSWDFKNKEVTQVPGFQIASDHFNILEAMSHVFHFMDLKNFSILLPHLKKYIFDPVFSDQFFTPVKESDLAVKCDYALPESAEKLGAFLQSEMAKPLMTDFKKSIDEIIQWAKENNIPQEKWEKLEKFYKEHSEYSGSNIEENKHHISLYHDGIPALGAALKLIHENKADLPASFLNQWFKNLVDDIIKCPNGAYTVMVSAYLSIIAKLHPEVGLMYTRLNLAKNLLNEKIIKEYKDMHGGMPLHYVYAVINDYANILGVPLFKDSNIQWCEEEILKKFHGTACHLFNKQFTPKTYLNNIITEEINLSDHIVEQPGGLEGIENRASGYDKENKIVFYKKLQDLLIEKEIEVPKKNDKGEIELNEKTNQPKTETKFIYHFSFDAYYALFANLFQTFIARGLFDSDNIIAHEKSLNIESCHHLNSKNKEHFFTTLASYVSSPLQKNVKTFVSYCIDIFSSNNETKKQELMTLIQSDIFSEEQREEIRNAICHYIYSYEYKTLENKDEVETRLLTALTTIIPLDKWHATISALPNSLHVNFLKILVKDRSLVTLVTNVNELKSMTEFLATLTLDELKNLKDLKNIKLDKTFSSPFIWACTEGYHQLVVNLLSLGIDGNEPSYNGSTPIMFALQGGHTKIVDTLLELDGIDLQAEGVSGLTALAWAIESKKIELVRLILQKGSNPHYRAHNGASAIYKAVDEKTTLEILEELIKQKIDLNIGNNDGLTPLMLAAQATDKNCLARMELLLKNGADCNAQACNLNTALMWAVCYKDSVDKIALLLKYGADVNLINIESKTALYFAVVNNNNLNIVGLLLENGAKCHVADKDKGNTPLIRALEKKYLNIAKLLIEKSTADELNYNNNDGNTPLKIAAQLGDLEILGLLIDKGVRPNLQTYTKRTALMHAVETKQHEAVKFLLEKGADTELLDNCNENVLHHAADRNDEKMIEIILEKNKSKSFINSKNINGKNALWYAVENDNLSMTKKLLENGADLHIKDKNGENLLMVAAKKGFLELAVYLIEKGINVHGKSYNGDTVLMTAAANNKTDIIQLALSKNVDSHMTNLNKHTALTYAIVNENIEATSILIKYTSLPIQPKPKAFASMFLEKHTKLYQAKLEKLFCKTTDLVYPLHFAIVVGNEKLIDLLLEAGETIHQNTPKVVNMIELARQLQQNSIVAKLEKKLAEQETVSVIKPGKTEIPSISLQGLSFFEGAQPEQKEGSVASPASTFGRL